MQKMLSYVRRAVDHYHMIERATASRLAFRAARTRSPCSSR